MLFEKLFRNKCCVCKKRFESKKLIPNAMFNYICIGCLKKTLNLELVLVLDNHSRRLEAIEKKLESMSEMVKKMLTDGEKNDG